MDFQVMGADPFEQINRLQHEMNRLFNGVAGTRQRAVYPAINIWGNKDQALVTTEIPGYETRDIDVSIAGDTLVLTGDRDPIKLTDRESQERQERICGRFERNIRLPFPVEEKSIKADYQNGVLTISLPRKEEDKPRKIQIQTS